MMKFRRFINFSKARNSIRRPQRCLVNPSNYPAAPAGERPLPNRFLPFNISSSLAHIGRAQSDADLGFSLIADEYARDMDRPISARQLIAWNVRASANCGRS
jgi:hypothetical protein